MLDVDVRFWELCQFDMQRPLLYKGHFTKSVTLVALSTHCSVCLSILAQPMTCGWGAELSVWSTNDRGWGSV